MTNPDRDLLGGLVPFYLIVDDTMTITEIGPSLAKFCPDVVGRPVAEAVTDRRPIPLDLSSADALREQTGEAVWLDIDLGELSAHLRGQLVAIDGGVLFACTLMVDESEELIAMGLSIDDFPAHDLGPDLLLLKQLRRHAREDARKTSAELGVALETCERLLIADEVRNAELALAGDIRLRTDADNEIVEAFVSPNVVRVVGAGMALVGENVLDVLPTFGEAMASGPRAHDEGLPHHEAIEVTTDDGTFYFDARVTGVRYGGVLLVARDVTPQLSQRMALELETARDPLTGLATAGLFNRSIENALDDPEADQLALIQVDLDRFAPVRDLLGRVVGEELLRTVAGRLNEFAADGDIVARLGDDEFGLLLTETASVKQVAMIAESIVDRIAEPFVADGCPITIGANVGVALSRAESTAEDLARSAALALDEGHGNGPGNVSWFEESMAATVQRRRDLSADLAGAIADEAIGVHYHPVVDLETGALRGIEALARWTHREHGEIPPEVFIPLAEKSDRIRQLDSLVHRRAIAQAAEWSEHLDRPVALSINVSGHSLREGLADELSDLLTAHDVPPHQLILEITETSLLADFDAATAVLEAVSARGIRVALDDFGTGYSSLTHLHQLPIDCVKIDRSFVARVTSDPKAERLVEAALAMAKASDAIVIPEGVETDEQAEKLRAMGCVYAQGFLWARPLPAEDAGDLVLGMAMRPVTPAK